MHRIALVLIVLLVLSPLFIPDANAAQDLSQAKVIFSKTCSKCHSTSRALSKTKDRAGWEKTVSRMSGKYKGRFGKPISSEDQVQIASYLYAVNLHAKTCTKCHDADKSLKTSLDRNGWTEVIDKMISFGAPLAGDDKELMIDFLTGNAGK